MAYKKLIKLSDNNPKVATEIVEQSLANNWAGLFKLKDIDKTEAPQVYRKDFNPNPR